MIVLFVYGQHNKWTMEFKFKAVIYNGKGTLITYYNFSFHLDEEAEGQKKIVNRY